MLLVLGWMLLVFGCMFLVLFGWYDTWSSVWSLWLPLCDHYDYPCGITRMWSIFVISCDRSCDRCDQGLGWGISYQINLHQVIPNFISTLPPADTPPGALENFDFQRNSESENCWDPSKKSSNFAIKRIFVTPCGYWKGIWLCVVKTLKLVSYTAQKWWFSQSLDCREGYWTSLSNYHVCKIYLKLD